MTWLELIDELRKQPLYLLERKVAVWCNVKVGYFEKPAIELTSPYNDSASMDEWLENSEFHLSLVIDLDRE